jgi:F-type H+-transporting ATPase subunit delta
MTDSTHAYAEAILAVAQAEGVGSVVEAELSEVANVVAGSPELATTLSDRGIPAARRLGVLEDVLGGKVSATTLSLVSMLVGNGRAGDLSAIVNAVIDLSAGNRGQAVAEVRSAIALTDDQKSRLAAALSAKLNRDVAIRNVVDPTVVGGVVTQVGDTLLDGSVRSRLTQLRDAF